MSSRKAHRHPCSPSTGSADLALHVLSDRELAVARRELAVAWGCSSCRRGRDIAYGRFISIILHRYQLSLSPPHPYPITMLFIDVRVSPSIRNISWCCSSFVCFLLLFSVFRLVWLSACLVVCLLVCLFMCLFVCFMYCSLLVVCRSSFIDRCSSFVARRSSVVRSSSLVARR